MKEFAPDGLVDVEISRLIPADDPGARSVDGSRTELPAKKNAKVN